MNLKLLYPSVFKQKFNIVKITPVTRLEIAFKNFLCSSVVIRDTTRDEQINRRTYFQETSSYK